MNPETTYLQNLETIERIAAYVAHLGHLNRHDTDEFVQIVRVHLFENDYAIIRKFEGRSQFSTYLRTVIGRRFQQWRVEMWGKWRPSAEARRLGDKAMMLECLLTRDGYTFSEAVHVLTTHGGDATTVAELEALYVRLPLRNPRPVLIPEESAPDVVAVDGDADARVESRDRECTARRCATALDAALAEFGAQDRLILELRFWHARKVPEIARITGIDPKKIYKRLEKLLAGLRRSLESAGIGASDIAQLLVHGDQEIRLGVLSSQESPSARPSHDSGGEEKRGGDRRVR